jgi:FtsH-binding integral membrane protein
VNLLQNALPLSSVSEQNRTSKKSQHSSQAMKKMALFHKVTLAASAIAIAVFVCAALQNIKWQA